MNVTNHKPNRTEVAWFVEQNFVSTTELSNWTLPDWKESPAILRRVRDSKYREWLRNLNIIWKSLARKMNDDVAKYPERHSLIYVKNGFIIPGGRFKGKGCSKGSEIPRKFLLKRTESISYRYRLLD